MRRPPPPSLFLSECANKFCTALASPLNLAGVLVKTKGLLEDGVSLVYQVMSFMLA